MNHFVTERELDDVDRSILQLLTENGRRSVADIAERVNLTAAPVTRRIERLERRGIILGYTTVVDDGKIAGRVEAFAELRFAGTADFEAIVGTVTDIPEIQEIFTTAGDPDALVRIRANDVEHLKHVINRLRRSRHIMGTKTLMVLDSWRRNLRSPPDPQWR